MLYNGLSLYVLPKEVIFKGKCCYYTHMKPLMQLHITYIYIFNISCSVFLCLDQLSPSNNVALLME